MSINKFNPEHYYDPTAYEALSAIQREEWKKTHPYRPLVFICSPFAGNMERNTINARQYSRFAVEQGAIPFAPHLLYPQFMDERDKKQRALGLFFGKVLLCKCDELWAFGRYISPGMKLELAKARKKGLCIRFFKTRIPEKPSGFLGEGEITERTNFHIYVEVSEAEFISTSEEVCVCTNL